jgi:gliding motility-associated protein GldC
MPGLIISLYLQKILAMAARETTITFHVQLDETNLPARISWEAQDGPQQERQETAAMMISLWDGKEKNSLRIDLWRKDFPVDEMHTFFFQTLLAMSDTYQRATGNPFVQEAMKQFCMDLADKTRTFEEERGNIPKNNG